MIASDVRAGVIQANTRHCEGSEAIHRGEIVGSPDMTAAAEPWIASPRSQ
jgi:hypothetical protein